MNDIEKAFQLLSTTDIILRIGEIIWKKITAEDDSLSNLSEAERNFIYVDTLEGQVNNGGFEQFFFNSSGEYTYQVVAAYNAIGAIKTVKIIEEAIMLFPVQPVPKDTDERRDMMEDLDESIADKWDKLDNEFYKYEESIDELIIKYMKDNIHLL